MDRGKKTTPHWRNENYVDAAIYTPAMQKTNEDVSVFSAPKYNKEKYETYIHYVMDKPRVKPDAPSPVMTPNNKAYYGGALDMSQKFSNARLENNTKSTNTKATYRNEMDINYNGDYLTANAYKISPQGDTLNKKSFTRRAYSGRPVGKDVSGKPMFDFSNIAQTKAETGPLPEGKYHIDAQNIQRYNPSMLREGINIIGGVTGSINRKMKFGNRPGGKYAWGNGLIDIFPDSTNTTKRKNFTIHGGKEPGSAGCIDLLDNDNDFFDFIEQNRGKLKRIPLSVDYSKKK